MFQNALIMILFNAATNRYHPIYYFESPLPGPIESQTVVRYKSKGHHTLGFPELKDALGDANELKTKLETNHCTVKMEPDSLLPWDGQDMPIDYQFR